MQSFLGSLNYYSRFIEDFATDASALYQLREADVFEISRQRSLDGSALKVETEQDPGSAGGSIEVVDQVLNTGNEVDSEGITRWEKAMIAFTMLKAKIAGTPILNHFDPERPPVIVVYASKWAISAALLQDLDGVNWPVIFTSRTLKPNKINNGTVAKELLALLRILDLCYTMLVGRETKVRTRHSTLAWLLQSPRLNGSLRRWVALLYNWTL